MSEKNKIKIEAKLLHQQVRRENENRDGESGYYLNRLRIKNDFFSRADLWIESLGSIRRGTNPAGRTIIILLFFSDFGKNTSPVVVRDNRAEMLKAGSIDDPRAHFIHHLLGLWSVGSKCVFLPWKSDLQNPVILFYFISHLFICKSL